MQRSSSNSELKRVNFDNKQKQLTNFTVLPHDNREDMNADSASCSLAMKRVNAQFNTVFGRLTKRRIFPFRQNQLNSTLPGNWVAFRPARANDHLGAISATLPRLCAKCRGSSCAAKLPDPFPQRTSSGCVWFRYNADLERGQVCVPSVRDAKLGNNEQIRDTIFS